MGSGPYVVCWGVWKGMSFICRERVACLQIREIKRNFVCVLRSLGIKNAFCVGVCFILSVQFYFILIKGISKLFHCIFASPALQSSSSEQRFSRCLGGGSRRAQRFQGTCYS